MGALAGEIQPKKHSFNFLEEEEEKGVVSQVLDIRREEMEKAIREI
jgi:hypothetical protein